MYLLVIAAITVAVVLLAWRGIGASVPRSDEDRQAPVYPRPPHPTRTRTVAPDDDPEFLAEVDRRLRGQDSD